MSPETARAPRDRTRAQTGPEGRDETPDPRTWAPHWLQPNATNSSDAIGEVESSHRLPDSVSVVVGFPPRVCARWRTSSGPYTTRYVTTRLNGRSALQIAWLHPTIQEACCGLSPPYSDTVPYYLYHDTTWYHSS